MHTITIASNPDGTYRVSIDGFLYHTLSRLFRDEAVAAAITRRAAFARHREKARIIVESLEVVVTTRGHTERQVLEEVRTERELQELMPC